MQTPTDHLQARATWIILSDYQVFRVGYEDAKGLLSHLEIAGAVSRLPQQYAPFLYGIIQAAITMAVATAIATHQLTGLSIRFLEQWFFAWALTFLTMLPVGIFVAPLIRRCVSALTVTAARERWN